MKFSSLMLLTTASVLLALSGPLSAKKEQELPEVTEDGLHRVHDSKMALVYAEPGADLSIYSKVQLLDAYVAFKKNWERDQRSRSAQPLHISSKDIDKIKTQLADEFKQEFTTVLEDESLSFVWSFITDEVGPGGQGQAEYDDLFDVTIDGISILRGSVRKPGGDSPFADTEAF